MGIQLTQVDRDGKWAETLWDIANVVMDVESARDNFSNGEIVSGLVDVGATVLDCIAAIAPGIPGGVGSVVKVARSTDKVTDAVKAVDKGIETTKTVDKGVESAKTVEHGTSAANKAIKSTLAQKTRLTVIYWMRLRNLGKLLLLNRIIQVLKYTMSDKIPKVLL